MKNIPLLFILVFLCIAGCDDGVEPNLATEVNGRVYDAVKDKYLANAKVVLLSCKKTSIGISCAYVIDTTFTDVNGNFYFSFKTRKKDFGYELEIEETEDFTKDRDKEFSVKVKAGKSNNLILPAREFSYLHTNLQVIENAFPPLVVSCQNSVRLVSGSNNDTTLVLRVLPQAQNYLIFSVYDSQAGSYRQRIDTLNINIQDTIFYSTACRIPDFELN